jgi:hypothetical protein
MNDLNLGIDAETTLEQRPAVNRQQNQRFRNAFAEHGGKLARLAINRGGPALTLVQIERGIVFAEHHPRHREVALQLVGRHGARDGVKQVDLRNHASVGTD